MVLTSRNPRCAQPRTTNLEPRKLNDEYTFHRQAAAQTTKPSDHERQNTPEEVAAAVAAAVVRADKGAATGGAVNDTAGGAATSEAVEAKLEDLKVEDLKDFKVEELKGLCRQRKLPTGGKKDVLKNRLETVLAPPSKATRPGDTGSIVQRPNDAGQPLATFAVGGEVASADEPEFVPISVTRNRREPQQPYRHACSDAHADRRMDISNAMCL